MVKVANLSADLTANTSSFDASMKKASRTMNRTGQKMSKDAGSFNKKVSNSFRRSAHTVAAFQGPLGGIAGRLSGLATIASTTGVAFGALILSISGAALAIGKAAFVADKFEGSMNRINAILKATGGASGQTGEDIRRMAEEIALGTLASVEGVEAAAAKLLTFRAIAGSTFRRTLELAQDLAATGFGSLSDNVTQLGKALEDPIRNLGALTRNGVSFTESQKNMIKSLVETGRAVEAQTIILDALAQQVGGAGAAEGGDIAKGLDALSQRFDEFLLAIDKTTDGSTKLAQAIKVLGVGLNAITEDFSPKDFTLTEKLQNARLELMRFQKTLEADGPNALLPITSQKALVASLEAEIKAIKDKSDAAQQAAVEAARQGRVEVENAKIAAAATKEAERREKAIRTTIAALEGSVVALEAESTAITTGKVSLEAAALARETLLTQQRLGVEVGSAEALQIEDLIRKREALKVAIADEVKTRERVKAIIEANKTEVEKLNEKLAEYNQLQKDGLLLGDDYAKAIERTKTKIDELDEANKKLKETMGKMKASVTDAFADFVTGATSAKDAVKQLGLQLLRSLAKTAGGNLFDLAGPAISAGLSSFSGFFAEGGRPPIGRDSVVGEKGPEVFRPDVAGTIIPNGQLGGGGGMTVFADMRGASVEAVQRLEVLVRELNGSIEPRAVDAVVSEKQRNPALFGA